MENSYFEHPTEEALERFLLSQCKEEELDVVETHVLACESCVARLEALETEIATMKVALAQLETERREKEAAKALRPSWRDWFTVPTLSWAGAGAAAALAVGMFVVPQFVPTEVSLSAYRGVEVPVVPEGRPLHLHLNANDLAAGPITVEVVNSQGAEIWKGDSTVNHDAVDVSVPRIKETGGHFLRLYAAGQANSDSALLREFAFEVK